MDIFDSSIDMIGSVVRLHSVQMTNFRNIKNSTIEFPDTKNTDITDGKPSILGLYGQNGSGKTSVIMSLGLLKNLVSGKKISNKYESCIRKGCDRATLSFIFSIKGIVTNPEDNNTDVVSFYSAVTDNSRYELTYKFDITTAKRKNDDTDENYIVVENEQLSIKITDSKEHVIQPKQVFIDTTDSICTSKMQSFGNKTKFKLLTGNDENVQTELFRIKAVTKTDSRSFIFSDDFMGIIFEQYRKEIEENKDYLNLLMEVFSDLLKLGEMTEKDVDEESFSFDDFINNIRLLLKESSVKYSLSFTDDEVEEANEDRLLEMWNEFFKNPQYRDSNIKGHFFCAIGYLVLFAKDKLHVVDTFSMGVINVNEKLPLMLKIGKKYNTYAEKYEPSYKTIMLNMNKPTSIEDDSYPSVDASIRRLSEVVSTIIPDLHLTIEDHGIRTDENEKRIRIIDVLACRDGVSIPLKYESDGIRRLISILSPMVGVYNDPSVMLAIDEIDSGIFEYLLGEILQIMSNSSKGQLVFTSHNLRPLEVLPSKCLAFTTTNENKRYTSIAARGNSNLRDTYFRNIVLGSKTDEIYRFTDPFDIEQAFIIAGE